MSSCHYRGCGRIPDQPLEFRLPKSLDPRLSKGGTIWLCKSHLNSVLFMLDIEEVTEEKGGEDGEEE